ncbi:MAG: hypothetical protein HQL35_14340, partial [Alphaproteobacteria bacterium]|nr:hypothetical protein [Alphaproteobacteria bacterium]
RGDFRRAAVEIDEGEGAGHRDTAPMLGVILSELTFTPAPRDTVVVAGAAWRVAEVEDTGDDYAWLHLQRI